MKATFKSLTYLQKTEVVALYFFSFLFAIAYVGIATAGFLVWATVALILCFALLLAAAMRQIIFQIK